MLFSIEDISFKQDQKWEKRKAQSLLLVVKFQDDLELGKGRKLYSEQQHHTSPKKWYHQGEPLPNWLGAVHGIEGVTRMPEKGRSKDGVFPDGLRSHALEQKDSARAGGRQTRRGSSRCWGTAWWGSLLAVAELRAERDSSRYGNLCLSHGRWGTILPSPTDPRETERCQSHHIGSGIYL